MGQDVQIRNTVVMGDVLVVDTDRSFTGQDGQAIGPDLDGDGVPAILAGRLFDLGVGIDHVFVLQNTVTVRRPGGWDEEASRAVADTTNSFLRFYEDEGGGDAALDDGGDEEE